MKFKLEIIRVWVSDWQRALHFYADILGLQNTVRNDETGWAQFATGECQLALERVSPEDEDGRRLVGRFVGASLAVGDIQTVYETLKARGVPFETPPQRQPWGGVLAHLRDPDGNTLTLLEASQS